MGFTNNITHKIYRIIKNIKNKIIFVHSANRQILCEMVLYSHKKQNTKTERTSENHEHLRKRRKTAR